MTMPDSFLYQFRQQPGEKFAQTLYQKISAEPVISAVFRFSPITEMGKALTLMGFTLAIMLAVSPDARATVFNHEERTR